MPIPDPEPIYADVAAVVEQAAEAAYLQTLALIAGGMAAGLAVETAMRAFEGEYAGAMAQAFSALLQREVTPASILAMPVGDITLSQRLYAHTQQTANEVAAIVRQQAQGITQARDLARRLYDGYNPADGIKRPLEGRARADLPKALRALTDDAVTRQELARLIERGQQQAARIKSEALKAAYLQAFEKATDGMKEQALRRALWVAEREKTRYMANRIAQTELKRAHTDAWAAEIMADEFVDVVQVKMNPRHPLPDICDVHARANLWGLGPGLYPKAKAPKPPFHPHCWCRLVTRPDLSAEKAREREGAVRELLRSMPAAEAARVLGSKERMAEVMNGGDWRKLPGIRLDRVGDAAESKRMQTSAFDDFFNNKSGSPERVVVATLTAAEMALFGVKNKELWLSRTSLDEHKAKHPEVTASDYTAIPEIVHNGAVWGGHQDRRYLLLQVGEKPYRAAIKVSQDDETAWFLSLVVSTKQKPPKGAVLLREAAGGSGRQP